MPKRPRENGPHECPECGRPFSQAVNLRRHIRGVHQGEKPHACPECPVRFTQACHLQQHIRGVHRDEKPHACPECPERFSRAEHLQQHVRAVHHGLKPHACPECPERFSRAEHLQQHVRVVHRGERLFACEQCEARFGQRNELKRHIEYHHTERGQQRQKKREEAVARFLTQAGYPCEREARVAFCSARDAPCPGESRPVNTSLARLDFVIYRPWGDCPLPWSARPARS